MRTVPTSARWTRTETVSPDATAMGPSRQTGEEAGEEVEADAGGEVGEEAGEISGTKAGACAVSLAGSTGAVTPSLSAIALTRRRAPHHSPPPCAALDSIANAAKFATRVWMIHQFRPHPEEPREARRLEGWAAVTSGASYVLSPWFETRGLQPRSSP